MGRALYDGWIGSGWEPSDIAIIDREPSRCIGNAGIHRRGETMAVIAVKPQHVAAALRENLHRLDAVGSVVSIAAGIELSMLRSLVPAPVPVFRAMPNLPVGIGKGIVFLCHQPDARPGDVTAMENALSRLGVCIVHDEAHADAFTAMAGSGPAYYYAFTEHLAQAGHAAGLPADLSSDLAKQVFIGAAALLERSGYSPAELREKVTSPAGTTAAGLQALYQDNALASLITRGVAAAKARSRALSSAVSARD